MRTRASRAPGSRARAESRTPIWHQKSFEDLGQLGPSQQLFGLVVFQFLRRYFVDLLKKFAKLVGQRGVGDVVIDAPQLASDRSLAGSRGLKTFSIRCPILGQCIDPAFRAHRHSHSPPLVPRPASAGRVMHAKLTNTKPELVNSIACIWFPSLENFFRLVRVEVLLSACPDLEGDQSWL